MTLTEYANAMAQRVEAMVEIPSDELLEDGDPYDVREFIELFGEDHASRMHDEQMALEALDHE